MTRRTATGLLLLGASGWAHSPQTLVFREDWAETPAEVPLSQKHVANPGLELKMYGPGAAQLKKSNHPEIPNDPYYVWSGLCEGNWLAALQPKAGPMDLRGGSVRWRSRQSGFRELRVAIRTEAGKWYVSEESDGPSDQWRVWSVDLGQTVWRELHMPRIHEGRMVTLPDLTRVVEVGFTDLMAGGQSIACSRLDWIEVHRAVSPPAPVT